MATGNSINANSPGVVVYDGAGTFSGRTLTPGAGISISNGDGIAGNPVITSTDAGFAWNNVTTTSATMVKENGYQANNVSQVVLTMPSVASSTFGDTIAIAGFGSGGFQVRCVAAQTIQFGSQVTTAAGFIASTNQFDQLELLCSSTPSIWLVRNAVGNLTIA